MGRQQNRRSLRSKAVHFVSDLTTVFLNPISDEHSKSEQPSPEDENEPKQCQQESIAEERSADLADGPDTSSFTAFLYSLLSSESGAHSNVDGKNEVKEEMSEQASGSLVKEVSRKKSLYSRGKQSLGRAVHQAAKLGGYRTQALELKGSSDLTVNDRDDAKVVEDKKIAMQTLDESILSDNLPEISEPSLLLSEKTRYILYLALPVLAQGRKWVLLYSTWRHGISLATLYRRSMLCPGLCLLVVGDRKGAVFGGLIEAPLRPMNKKYQGSNNSFVFTNTPGHPVIFRPTGINRYFTLCSSDFLALGGGGHFALYLDGDMLKGSSSASETYGNSCLAHTEDFEVKEIELWSFVYGSKYEEMVSMLRVEAPGICHLFA